MSYLGHSLGGVSVFYSPSWLGNVSILLSGLLFFLSEPSSILSLCREDWWAWGPVSCRLHFPQLQSWDRPPAGWVLSFFVGRIFLNALLVYKTNNVASNLQPPPSTACLFSLWLREWHGRHPFSGKFWKRNSRVLNLSWLLLGIPPLLFRRSLGMWLARLQTGLLVC